MAHVKSGSSTKLGRDSKPKNLGVKLYGGQVVKTGQIILRQRGSKWKNGSGTKIGKDDTVFAIKDGVVKFSKKTFGNFYGKKRVCTMVEVV